MQYNDQFALFEPFYLPCQFPTGMVAKFPSVLHSFFARMSSVSTNQSNMARTLWNKPILSYIARHTIRRWTQVLIPIWQPQERQSEQPPNPRCSTLQRYYQVICRSLCKLANHTGFQVHPQSVYMLLLTTVAANY